jgi:hypothetical protein
VLFGPARALRITYDAVQQNPEHALGIILGMLAATEAYDAELAKGLTERVDPEMTHALEPPTAKETAGPRTVREPSKVVGK